MRQTFLPLVAVLLLLGSGGGVGLTGEDVSAANRRVVRELALPATELSIHVDRQRGASLYELMQDFFLFSGGLPYRFDPESLGKRRLEEFHVRSVPIGQALLKFANEAGLRFALERTRGRSVLVIRSCRSCGTRSAGIPNG